MAIYNDRRRVYKNRRQQQKKTAEALGLELPPRFPDHPSVKRIAAMYKYNRRLDIENHTLGTLLKRGDKPEFSGGGDHRCSLLGSIQVPFFWRQCMVSVCRHHRNSTLGTVLNNNTYKPIVGVEWLKQFMPKDYAEWRRVFRNKDQAKNQQPWYKEPKGKTPAEMRAAYDNRYGDGYVRTRSGFLEAYFEAQRQG